MAKKSEKILVTGGAGFIGSEFVRQLLAQKRQVIVVDCLTYAGDVKRLEGLKGQFTFYKTDIAHMAKVMSIFKKERPTQVLHFAAESHVDRSILSDVEFVRTNINGTQSVLTAARACGVEKFIHMSTDEVYGEIAKGKFKEDFPLKPKSPYSASKAASDLLVGAYHHTFNLPTVIVRASNNYGPWQYPEKFIPVIIYKALTGQPIPVYAKGLNVREWLHISDCARALIGVLDHGRVGEVYNIGSGDERRNIDVVHLILDMLKKPKGLITFVQDRPGHDWRYALDSQKIRRELKWQPNISFEKGLQQTVAWNQEHLAWLTKKSAVLKAYWQKVYRA